MRWVVIHNIRASKRSRTRASLAEVLEDCGIDAEVHETTTAEQCAEVIASAHSGGTGHYVAAGGDGTLHGVVNALMAHEWPEPPAVGILPLGSGSDFARSFALPRRLDRAIAHLNVTAATSATSASLRDRSVCGTSSTSPMLVSPVQPYPGQIGCRESWESCATSWDSGSRSQCSLRGMYGPSQAGRQSKRVGSTS